MAFFYDNIFFRIMEDLCKEDSIDSNPDGDAGNTQIKLPEGQTTKAAAV